MKYLKRIIHDFEEINKNIKEDIVLIDPIDDSFLHWKVIIKGPKDTPYENGNFELNIIFSTRYPFQAPEIRFITKIFHVNCFDETGAINSDLLGFSKSNWSPGILIYKFINQIIYILKNPVFENFYIIDPTKFKYVNPDQRDEYNKTAKEWTEKYAKTNYKTVNEWTKNMETIYKKDKSELNKLNEDIYKILNHFGNESILFLLMKLKLFYVQISSFLKDEKVKILELKKQLNSNSDNIIKIKEIIRDIKEIREIEIYKIRNINYELELKKSILSGNKEKLIVNFISLDENIHYAINCEETDKFSKIEELLYEKYPEYKNTNNHFIINGNQIIKDKNLKDNKIKDNDIITLIISS